MRMVGALVLACFPLHAAADVTAGEKKAQLCILCHKPSDMVSGVPLLEGQPASYLVTAITAYKTGRRKDAVMNANVANLSNADIRDISDYFASRPFPSRTQKLEPGKVSAGEKLVGEMKCSSCHTPNFHATALIPRLAGQTYWYLTVQMAAFRDGRRDLPPGMPVLKDATDIENAASYLASLQ
jgi:cytochrome c553